MMTPEERTKTIDWLRSEAARIEAYAQKNDKQTAMAPFVTRLRSMADRLEKRAKTGKRILAEIR